MYLHLNNQYNMFLFFKFLAHEMLLSWKIKRFWFCPRAARSLMGVRTMEEVLRTYTWFFDLRTTTFLLINSAIFAFFSLYVCCQSTQSASLFFLNLITEDKPMWNIQTCFFTYLASIKGIMYEEKWTVHGRIHLPEIWKFTRHTHFINDHRNGRPTINACKNCKCLVVNHKDVVLSVYL